MSTKRLQGIQGVSNTSSAVRAIEVLTNNNRICVGDQVVVATLPNPVNVSKTVSLPHQFFTVVGGAGLQVFNANPTPATLTEVGRIPFGESVQVLAFETFPGIPYTFAKIQRSNNIHFFDPNTPGTEFDVIYMFPTAFIAAHGGQSNITLSLVSPSLLVSLPKTALAFAGEQHVFLTRGANLTVTLPFPFSSEELISSLNAPTIGEQRYVDYPLGLALFDVPSVAGNFIGWLEYGTAVTVNSVSGQWANVDGLDHNQFLKTGFACFTCPITDVTLGLFNGGIIPSLDFVVPNSPIQGPWLSKINPDSRLSGAPVQGFIAIGNGQSATLTFSGGASWEATAASPELVVQSLPPDLRTFFAAQDTLQSTMAPAPLSDLVTLPFTVTFGNRLRIFTSFCWQNDLATETRFDLVITDPTSAETTITKANQSNAVAAGTSIGSLNGSFDVVTPGQYTVSLRWLVFAGTATMDPESSRNATITVMEVNSADGS